MLPLIVVVSAPLESAADVAGIWKHANESGWIKIRIEKAVDKGTVVRNDVHPERVGREILKRLRRKSRRNLCGVVRSTQSARVITGTRKYQSVNQACRL
jgi:hypothetical protein